ncbi:MAG: acyl-CoA/acyl-ACP dehydrogenase [Deltaproteobacteria bacterium]|nr:acyl-CoA/acyl-ACP dehydrogenase [Deltaproteobacteria bacterium]
MTSQNMMQEHVRKFLAAELLPNVDQLNEDGVFPEKVFRSYFKAGFGASFFPEEWGGDGDILGYLDAAAEMGRVDLGFALSVMASSVLFGNNVLLHGTDEQKKKYLPGISDGTKIGCWALTEPSGGSDAVGTKSTCEKDGDHYVLNGSKTFITNAPVADYFVMLTRLKDSTAKSGFETGCAFLLEKGMKGLTTGQPLKKMGHKTSPTGEIFMENVRVHKSQLLGAEGRAFLDMKKSLDFERASFSGIGMGIIDELINIMVKYAAARQVFGKPILEYQLIQEKIAEISAQFEVMKCYTQLVRDKISRGERITKEAAIVKLLLSRLGVRAADQAIQVLGGYGYMTEYKVERIYRDMKLYEIGGGTSEIQQLIIAKETIKEYINKQGVMA